MIEVDFRPKLFFPSQAQSERNREKIFGRMKNRKFHSILFPDQGRDNSPTTSFNLLHNGTMFEDYIAASLENVPTQGLPASTIQRVRKVRVQKNDLNIEDVKFDWSLLEAGKSGVLG